MVSGNHEFYGHHFTNHLDAMREAANKYNIDFLEADAVDLGCSSFHSRYLIPALTERRHRDGVEWLEKNSKGRQTQPKP